MEFTLANHKTHVEVTTSGEASTQGFAAFLDALIDSADWSPGTPILVDHSRLQVAPMTMGDVERVADHCAARRAQLGPASIALVVADRLQFGLCRMWGAFIEGRWEAHAELFESRDAAVAWLRV